MLEGVPHCGLDIAILFFLGIPYLTW